MGTVSECLRIDGRRCLCKNSDFCQCGAILERIVADGRHGILNCHARQGRAVSESIEADGCHGDRNGNARQAGAFIERGGFDARHGVRDDRVHAPKQQLVGSRFNDGITIVTGVIYGVFCIHRNTSQAGTSYKNSSTDGCHGARDGNACQGGAIQESRTIDPRQRVREGDSRQFFAALVFASCFISAGCNLKGRKVMSFIL